MPNETRLTPVRTEHTLPGLNSGLFVHSYQQNHRHIRALIAEDGLGAVVSLSPHRKKRDMRAEAQAVVADIRHGSPESSLLIDANRYSGRNRKRAAAGLTEGWTRHQLRASGLPYALTDSGYIDSGDKNGLEIVLKASAALEDNTVCVLPLHLDWLVKDLDHLVARINHYARPIAVALEHKKDPMAEKDAVRGLVTLLALPVPVLVLRSDMSALGALAHGSAGVAIGTESALRHTYPIVNTNGGRKPPLSILVPELLGYYHAHKITDAIQLHPDLRLWSCPCQVCAGRQIEWIRFSSDPAASAFGHSLSALASIGREIGRASAANRPGLWADLCLDAQLRHFDVTIGAGDKSWEPKGALGRWISVTPARIGQP